MTEPRPGAGDQSLSRMMAEAAVPLPDPSSADFAAAFDRFAACRVVLLGEASHGTAEFYRARAAITRRLIAQHGFTIVAVEADWPDAAAVDRYIRARPPAPDAEKPFQRFPQWMWRNTEVLDLVAWLRHHNDTLAAEEHKAGFYGLDLYNMGASIAAVLDYLDRTDPEAARIARQRYGCLTPWESDPARYGRAAVSDSYRACEDQVVAQCRDLHRRQCEAQGEGLFEARQNARLIAAAERYYRVMYYGGAQSWNLRDTHMFETLSEILAARGPGSKAIVWAHNSHIGDARHTEMGKRLGEINLGQLCRQRFGAAAALIGFSTGRGTVAAASEWGGPMQVMQVNPSRPGSHERLCHDTGLGRFLLDFRKGAAEALRAALDSPRPERFIGVIYRPESEVLSHYAEAVLPRQFDGLAWFDATCAVTPLGPEHFAPGIPDTFPFGL